MRFQAYIAAILVLSGLFVGARNASANSPFQEGPVQLSTIGSDSLSAAPGDVVTIRYRVEATSDMVVTPSFHVPPGWMMAFGGEDITLKKGSPTVRNTVFKISKGALSTSYSVGLELLGKDNSILARIETPIFVKQIYSLLLEADPLEPFAPAGLAVNATFHLSNNGNTPISVALSAKGREFIQVDISESVAHLEPGETKQVHATINSDANLDHTIKTGIRFEARILENESVSQYKTVSYEVIPVYARVRPKVAAVPLSLSFDTVGDEDGVRPQARVAGAFKALDGQISVRATIADKQRQKMFGADQEINVQYNRDNLIVKLGDHAMSMSPMTVSGEQGLGAAIEVASGDWNVKSTIQRSRHSFPVQDLVGVSVSKKTSETSFASANLLHRTGLYEGSLATFRGVFQPFGPTARFDVECGVNSGQLLADPTCSAIWTQSGSRWSMRVRGQKAAKSFPGSIAGLNQISEFSSFRVSQKFRIDNSLNFLTRDLGDGFARSSRFVKTGITYSDRIKRGTFYVTSHGIHSKTSYQSLFDTVERNEMIFRATTGYYLRKFGLTASFERGSAQTGSETGNGTFQRVKTNVRGTLRSSININASYEYSTGNLSAITKNQRQSMYGLGATFAMPGGIAVSASAFLSSIRTSFDQQYASLRTRVSKTFRSGHLLTLQAQANRSKGRILTESTDYIISYSLPLSLPFGPDGVDSKLLKGQIVDEISASGIPGVIVFLGENVSITDANGRFAIPRKMDRGEYLRLDQKSLGFDRIPTSAFPMEITPESNVGHELVISVGPSATLTGQVNVFSLPDGQDEMLGTDLTHLVLNGGVSSAIIQISSSTHRVRTRTDRNGKFQFGQLPEGTYTVEVIQANLKEYQRVKTPSLNVTVEAGQSNNVEFKVIPVRKQLRIIKSSTLTIDETNVSNSPEELNQTSSKKIKRTPKATPAKLSDNPVELDATLQDEYDNASSLQPNTSDAGWLDLMKGSAFEASKDTKRGAVIIPFYVDVSPPSPGSPISTPVYISILILSIFFFLVSIELIIRNITEMHRTVVRTIGQPSWIWAYRQSTVYAVLIVTSSYYVGPLGGFAIALGLAGITLTIETKDQYQNMGAILYLLVRSNLRTGSWISYQSEVGQITQLTLNNITLTLLTGQRVELAPYSLLHVSTSKWKKSQVTCEHLILHFSRISDLRTVRTVSGDVLSTFAPVGTTYHADIRFEDIDAQRTQMIVKAVVDGNRATKGEIVADLMTALRHQGIEVFDSVETHADRPAERNRMDKEYPSLRLVIRSDDKAA